MHIGLIRLYSFFFGYEETGSPQWMVGSYMHVHIVECKLDDRCNCYDKWKLFRLCSSVIIPNTTTILYPRTLSQSHWQDQEITSEAIRDWIAEVFSHSAVANQVQLHNEAGFGRTNPPSNILIAVRPIIVISAS
jgi:hypothetical protein